MYALSYSMINQAHQIFWLKEIDTHDSLGWRNQRLRFDSNKCSMEKQNQLSQLITLEKNFTKCSAH